MVGGGLRGELGATVWAGEGGQWGKLEATVWVGIGGCSASWGHGVGGGGGAVGRGGGTGCESRWLHGDVRLVGGL